MTYSEEIHEEFEGIYDFQVIVGKVDKILIPKSIIFAKVRKHNILWLNSLFKLYIVKNRILRASLLLQAVCCRTA